MENNFSIGEGLKGIQKTISESYPGCVVDFNLLPKGHGIVLRLKDLDGKTYHGFGNFEIHHEGNTVTVKTFISYDK